MKLTLGFSPCPNDTFIFDALIHNKIGTSGFEFDVVLEDVQTLNDWALQGKLDITKISFGVLPLILNDYAVLNSGSALGKGVGPLLISKGRVEPEDVELNPIAIPGKNTTAHLLFSLAFPNAKNKIFLRYNEIENFVLQGSGLGVIIHENRFTYLGKGLSLITDLGNYWEKETGNPIPLGGIVIKRNIALIDQNAIDKLIRKSIEFSFSGYPELSEYIKQHAQEMNEDVMRKHIELYVNNFSLDLREDGMKAIMQLVGIYNHRHVRSVSTTNLFVSKEQV